jgi:serine protease Do
LTESFIDRLRDSTFQISNGAGGGAGIAWPGGLIVTNAHVLRGEKVFVMNSRGGQAPARVVRRDSERDLAVLSADLRAEPAIIGDSSRVKPGEIVWAIGNPLGRTGAVAMGSIHAIGPLRLGSRRDWIQASVRLAPGNSGGVLANADGEVIGINTMVFGGLGLAIPSNEARAFVGGEFESVRLGVEMIPIAEGLLVVGIQAGSVAERSGVFVGDIIPYSADELRSWLFRLATVGAGELSIIRAGKSAALRVTAERGARAA